MDSSTTPGFRRRSAFALDGWSVPKSAARPAPPLGSGVAHARRTFAGVAVSAARKTPAAQGGLRPQPSEAPRPDDAVDPLTRGSGDEIPGFLLKSDMPRVHLNEHEFRIAHYFAGVRQSDNKWAGLKDRFGAEKRDGWELHENGVLAELAFAKHMGLYYNGNIGDLKADDVGSYQVRSRRPKPSDPADYAALFAHDSDKDDRAYALALGPYFRTAEDGTRSVVFFLGGWMMGREAKSADHWNERLPNPCYAIPFRRLNAMDTLPRPSR